MRHFPENNTSPLRTFALLLVIVVGLVVIFASGGHADSQPTPTGPKNGNVVKLQRYVDKWCDGPNLVYQYWNSGISVIPDSSECK